MGLEKEAHQYISEILARILFEILEQTPINAEDLLQKVKVTFPLALSNFVSKVKFFYIFNLQTFMHILGHERINNKFFPKTSKSK
jgi:hypothetical protein